MSGQDVLSFIIGDVSGHGPDAAALGATLRSTWKALTLSGQPLTKVPQVMTSLITGERSSPNAFATILVGRIDLSKRLLTWINAGHMPPLLITDQVIGLDSRPTPPLGVGDDLHRKPHQYHLPERWSLFCYTDGLIDARVSAGSSDRYGEDRLKERLAAWATNRPNAEAVDSLLAEVETASGARFADDVATLLITTKEQGGAVARG
jgi:serine phosphatase RsbU (regulator of sigma subunit)